MQQQQQSAATHRISQQWTSASKCGYSFPSPCTDCVTALDCPEPSCSTSDELTSLCTDQCIVVACTDPEHRPNTHTRCDLGYDSSTPLCLDCDEIQNFLQCCDGLDNCYVNHPRSARLPQQSQVQRARGHDDWDATLAAALCDCEHMSELRSLYSSTTTTSSSPHDGSSRSTQPTLTPSASCSLAQPYTSMPQPYSPVVPTEAQQSGNSPYTEPQDQQQLTHAGSSTTAPLTCMWGNCQMQFQSLSDLVGHVNLAHLCIHSEHLGSQTNYPSPPAQNIDDKMPCLWGDCTEHLLPPSLSGGATLSGFVNHLFQDHLGLHPSHYDGQHGSLEVDRMLAEMMALQHSEQNRIQAPQHVPFGREVAGSTDVGNIDSVAEKSGEDNTNLSIPPRDASSSTTSSPRTVASTISSIISVGETPKNPHVCLWEGCMKSFETCDDLMTHISAAHVGSGKPRYDCLWEGCMRNGEKGFSSKQKICRHLQSHTGYRPFQCPDCLQNFSEAATLQQHQRRHTQEKPYKCDFPGCGKSFAITGALTIHKRVHNGQKPFKCKYCGRGFAESSNLSKHLRTHTGERPYVCAEPGCTKAFARPDQLTRHMNVHRIKEPEPAV